jgi:hypothetical protein
MALEKMPLPAGYSEASQVGQLILETEPGKESFATPHIVVKDTVQPKRIVAL